MMRIGLLEIDPATRRVCLEGQAIDLSRREFAVLEALARRPDHIVSRGAIEEAIYGWQEEVGSNAVEVHIHKLRAKLGTGVIETVRGLGYRIGSKEADRKSTSCACSGCSPRLPPLCCLLRPGGP